MPCGRTARRRGRRRARTRAGRSARASRSLRRVPGELPSFDLVVATVGRVEELGRLLDSLERQTHRRFTVRVVDQNEDDRLRSLLAAHPGLEIAHLQSPPGLSRARNAALEGSQPTSRVPRRRLRLPGRPARAVASLLLERPGLDALTGRAESLDGRSSASWKSEGAARPRQRVEPGDFLHDLRPTRRHPPGRPLRRAARSRLGHPVALGEEIDYLLRALAAGAVIEYDPSLVVHHEVGADDSRTGLRDGASIGYLLRKHRYPPRVLARMLVRPVGGVASSLARGDRERARFHAATLRGRVAGYRGASDSNSSR